MQPLVVEQRQEIAAVQVQIPVVGICRGNLGVSGRVLGVSWGV